jgi:DNA processing protein
MNACAACIEASFARAEKLSELETRAASADQVRRALERQVERDSEARERDEFDRTGGVWVVCRHQPEYPVRLTHFERSSDVPSVIYGVGSRRPLQELAERPGVAIVGARRASAYGRETSYSLARDCAESGLVVVSGMALGIDGAAHRGALQGGGTTIAVLAGGPERPYPRSHRLLHEQIVQSGCVLSEMPPGVEARRWGFVARNRIIAALSAITVFVEGAEDSGARHTVGFAEDLGLEIGAVPGPVTSPMSAGPNTMLAENRAAVIRGAGDVFDLIGHDRASATARTDELVLGGTSARICAAVASGLRSPRAISEELSDLGQREISRILGELELSGRIRRVSAGEYELKDV